MKLIRIETFIELYFGHDKNVSAKTVRNWIKDGQLPGTCIGSRYFVDVMSLHEAVRNPPFRNCMLYRPCDIYSLLPISRCTVWRIIRDSGIQPVYTGDSNRVHYKGSDLNRIFNVRKSNDENA